MARTVIGYEEGERGRGRPIYAEQGHGRARIAGVAAGNDEGLATLIREPYAAIGGEIERRQATDAQRAAWAAEPKRPKPAEDHRPAVEAQRAAGAREREEERSVMATPKATEPITEGITLRQRELYDAVMKHGGVPAAIAALDAAPSSVYAAVAAAERAGLPPYPRRNTTAHETPPAPLHVVEKPRRESDDEPERVEASALERLNGTKPPPKTPREHLGLEPAGWNGPAPRAIAPPVEESTPEIRTYDLVMRRLGAVVERLDVALQFSAVSPAVGAQTIHALDFAIYGRRANPEITAADRRWNALEDELVLGWHEAKELVLALGPLIAEARNAVHGAPPPA